MIELYREIIFFLAISTNNIALYFYNILAFLFSKEMLVTLIALYSRLDTILVKFSPIRTSQIISFKESAL
jgi:hypothetical protein